MQDAWMGAKRSVEPWQANLLGQIVDRVDEFLAGRLSLRKVVEDARGLFDAANIPGKELRWEFEAAWSPVDGQLELLTEPWGDPDSATAKDTSALLNLRKWAADVAGRADA